MRVSAAIFLWFCSRDSCAFTSLATFSRTTNRVDVPLFGLLDEINSDAYDLTTSKTNNVDLSNAYEMMLAELVFSTNDPRVDIVNKLELVTDPEFLAWLEQEKIEKSMDPEERMALKDLMETILDVKTKVEVSRLAEERKAKEQAAWEAEQLAAAQADAVGERQLTNAEILKKATAIQTQVTETELEERKEKKKNFYEQELTAEIRLSYESLLKKVLPPYKSGETPDSVVYIHYDQFDAQFVKVLSERSENGDIDSKNILSALATEQQKRIAASTETLKSVLSLGEPMRMEGAIVKLAREGKLDEAFLLLLEANENQARSAGANGPAQLMRRLRERAMDEKDKQQQSKEIRLLRQLLRTDDPAKRETILEGAFTPKATLIVPGTAANAQKAVDGEAPDQEQPMPEVPPPDFINACKAVLLNFGNLGADDAQRGDLASRIHKIAAEAEAVTTRIYGKGMTLREQQDRMWAEQTTSIFDLERMEIEAERNGERAPWTNPNADDEMLIPGFDKQGRMQIGGDQ
jgi:hypothetical protein